MRFNKDLLHRTQPTLTIKYHLHLVALTNLKRHQHPQQRN